MLDLHHPGRVLEEEGSLLSEVSEEWWVCLTPGEWLKRVWPIQKSDEGRVSLVLKECYQNTFLVFLF